MRKLVLALAMIAGLLVVPAGPAQAANLLTNPGFETGTLAPWTCSGGLGTVVSSPVRTGTRALQGAASASDNARCTQAVSVRANTAYTLTAWVRGDYVYLGVNGGASTWTPSATAFTQLTLAFTTGTGQTSVQIFVHGWYGQGSYYADDISLDGPGGVNPPPAPTGLTAGSVTDTSVSLAWNTSAGATGYRVYDGTAPVASPAGTSATISGLTPCSTHAYSVSAVDSNGESARTAPISVTTGGCTNPGLPRHALIGYLHASFANGSGYLRMADVPAAWDIINLAFGEPAGVTSGNIQFRLCPVTECPGVETETQFIAAIRAKQAAGKKVLLSIGGQNGQVQLTTAGARDAFVSSVAAIIDRYGLDGLDIDFEGHSLFLNAGDNDFRNPTTPVIVNLIAALRALKTRYGTNFVLTMAPETFFVQLGYQFYGGNCAGCDRRAGSYLPVIYAMRNDITVLHVQDYNSGPIWGLDNQYHTMGGADFHIAMTDLLKAGFPVAGTGLTFPGLRPDQIAFGTPAAVSAGNGFTPVAGVQQALGCLARGTNCGGYTLRGGTSPALRGLMTWSINWDRFYGWEFMNNHEPVLNGLP